MRLFEKNQADLAAGLFFTVLAVAFLWLGSDFPVGSALRMGPGYVPRLICLALGALGLLVIVRGVSATGEPIGGVAWRPLILVLGSILVFAVALKTAGLVIATALLVLISSFADGTPGFGRTVALGVGLSLFAVLLFVVALSLPIDVWPSF